MDDVNGGRLIFYDFGMMGRFFFIPYFVLLRSKYLCTIVVVSLPNEYFLCVFSISPNIREGLLDVFYGVYEKDPDKVNFLP